MKQLLVLAFLGLTLGFHCFAARIEPAPKELEGVGIEERLGAQVPLEAVFKDEEGREVTLRELIAGKPTLLTLVYYRCPMLCGLVLQGLLDALKGLPSTVGEGFNVITVSIDPLETPTLAKLKKQNYLAEYGRPGVAGGWHFLTGQASSIRKLADSVGFFYKWNEERQEYAHGAGVFVLTPQGTVARTIFGVLFESRTLQLALSEAREGKTSVGEKVVLFCFRYDAKEGRYVVAATRVMQMGGLLSMFILGSWLFRSWIKQKRGTP